MLATYFPEREIDITRSKKTEVLKQIDWIGAFLSIVGVTLL